MTDQATLTYLKSERARRPELADTLDLHIALLEARENSQSHSAPSVPLRGLALPIQLRADEARARLERGEALLTPRALALDWDALARLVQAICQIAARHRPTAADAFAELAALFENDHARAEETVCEYLETTRHPAVSSEHPTPQLSNHRTIELSDYRTFILNNALHPYLSAHARALMPWVDDATWYRAYCPICGGAPDFSALEKESGARRLLCARCNAVWTFHRTRCPFCGEEAADKFGYYASADSVYRLYTCETCKRYLKTIDLRELAREVNLPAERILTIGMDLSARGAGYR